MKIQSTTWTAFWVSISVLCVGCMCGEVLCECLCICVSCQIAHTERSVVYENEWFSHADLMIKRASLELNSGQNVPNLSCRWLKYGKLNIFQIEYANLYEIVATHSVVLNVIWNQATTSVSDDNLVLYFRVYNSKSSKFYLIITHFMSFVEWALWDAHTTS